MFQYYNFNGNSGIFCVQKHYCMNLDIQQRGHTTESWPFTERVFVPVYLLTVNVFF
jgi:hypothetical protein